MFADPMPSPVSVVVVSFNTCEQLRKCLSAIESEHEVIVVDNASMDGSAAMVESEFPNVKLIRSDVNLGFGKANNRGDEIATRSLLLYLNSDAYVESGAIRRLAQAFEDESVVAAGPKLLNPDRSLQESVAKPLTLGAVFAEQIGIKSGYWETSRYADRDEPSDVAQVMGAALMARRGLERFDERYFLYCEDTDLCHRLRRHGRIRFVPEAKVIHELGTSSKANPWLGIARYNAGKELYFRIHYGKMASLICWKLDRLGALLRLVTRPHRAEIWWKVLTARTAQLSPSNSDSLSAK